MLIDAVGNRHEAVGAPARIVSLVPSLTELLFALDLQEQLVGRTAFCIEPEGQVETIPVIGGT
ncbi:MAG: cobalamin-binding protein, partial [Alphaproteobacteria bacterium]|nr:cobalamin-binding protein [Alphaproteobacteria bacterium]